MKDKSTSSESASLFRDHLRILNLDLDGQQAVTWADEKRRIEALDLPALELPANRAKWSRHRILPGAFAVAAAAALALFYLRPQVESPEELTMKGNSHVTVYYKKAETVVPLGPEEKLPSEVLFRIEITPAISGRAFLFFMNGQQKTALDQRPEGAPSVALKAGERISFPGSQKLVGPNVSEVAAVVVCSDLGAKSFSALSGQAVGNALQATLSRTDGKLSGLECSVILRQLR